MLYSFDSGFDGEIDFFRHIVGCDDATCVAYSPYSEDEPYAQDADWSHENMSIAGIIRCYDGTLVFSDSRRTETGDAGAIVHHDDETKIFDLGIDSKDCFVLTNQCRFGAEALTLGDVIAKLPKTDGLTMLNGFASYCRKNGIACNSLVRLVHPSPYYQKTELYTCRTADNFSIDYTLCDLGRCYLMGMDWAVELAGALFSSIEDTKMLWKAKKAVQSVMQDVYEAERHMSAGYATVGGDIAIRIIRCDTNGNIVAEPETISLL